MKGLSKRILTQTLGLVGEGVVLLDRERVVYWNRTARRVLGVRGLRAPVDLRDLAPAVAHALSTGDFTSFLQGPGPVRRMALDEDLTAIVVPPLPDDHPGVRRFLETEQKVVVGQVSGAVAREIGAPLLAIQAAADRLLREVPESHGSARENIGLILDQTHRIAGLSRSLIDLAEPGRPRLVPLPVRLLVGDVVDLLGRSLAEDGVSAMVGPGPEGLEVLADRSKARQVLLNLVLNAQRVLAAGNGVRSLRIQWRDEGDEVEVWVEDSGPGVRATDAQRIFLPFYSGYGGSGLGLPMARQILAEMGGSLRLESSPLGGAAFVVTLRKA